MKQDSPTPTDSHQTSPYRAIVCTALGVLLLAACADESLVIGPSDELTGPVDGGPVDGLAGTPIDNDGSSTSLCPRRR